MRRGGLGVATDRHPFAEVATTLAERVRGRTLGSLVAHAPGDYNMYTATRKRK